MSAEEGEYGDWRARLERREVEGRRPGPEKQGTAAELGLLPGARWATWLAGVGLTPVQIPGAYWSRNSQTEPGLDLDGHPTTVEVPTAIVACPCGNEPTVRSLAPPTVCGGDGCERYFFFDGDSVYVFNSTKDRPSDEPAPEQIPPDGPSA